MENETNKSMMEQFPIEQLVRMIQNIDRFDTEVPNETKKKADEAIEKSEELTEQIVEENL